MSIEVGRRTGVRAVRVLVGAVACLLLVAMVAVGEASAGGKTEGWTRVVAHGLTDRNNTYAPSSAQFRDHLYLSTIASPAGTMYSGSHKLGGEIWRSPDGVTWERVGEPGLGDPDNVSFSLVTFHDRLYAVSTNTETGLEIWASSDGVRFSKIDTGSLGGRHDTGANPFVFRDRLLLGVTNSVDGAQIWVSEDGATLKAVVTGGMGDRHTNGVQVWGDPQEPAPVFHDELYASASDPVTGGETWRTADGLQWERAPDKGLGRGAKSVVFPSAVFEDRLYAVRFTAGTLDDIRGLDVYRTADGDTWEKVVSNGFGVGHERNATGLLSVFQGAIYLSASTYDPRVLLPGKPSERLAPRGFQLYRSSDGVHWDQVGEDGFGADSAFSAGAVDTFGDTAYLAVFDYRRGDQLWRSANGADWQLVFQQPRPSWYAMGGGPLDYQGHLLMIDNDLKRGVDIWRTDAMVVAQGGMSASPEASPEASPAAGGDGTGEGSGQTETAGGVSGAWLVAIVAIVAVLAAVAAFAVVRARGRRVRSAGRAAAAGQNVSAGAAGTPAVTPEAGAGSEPAGASRTPASRSFCSSCGSALDPGARFCANCGKDVPGAV
jgi:hypothetical protein